MSVNPYEAPAAIATAENDNPPFYVWLGRWSLTIGCFLLSWIGLAIGWIFLGAATTPNGSGLLAWLGVAISTILAAWLAWSVSRELLKGRAVATHLTLLLFGVWCFQLASFGALHLSGTPTSPYFPNSSWPIGSVHILFLTYASFVLLSASIAVWFTRNRQSIVTSSLAFACAAIYWFVFLIVRFI